MIGPTVEIDPTEGQRAAVKEAAEAIRPDLSPTEKRVLDQMLKLGRLVRAAKELDLSKGYTSRVWNGLVEKIQRRKA